MSGLFSILNLGANSLQAQQAGVQVTGQNLANANNPAYSRQRVVLTASPSTATANGLVGNGVSVTGIEQLRNALLDSQVASEASVSGYWNSQQSVLQDAQTQLGQFLSSGSSGTSATGATGGASGPSSLADQINGLFNAFQAVAANPTDLTARQALVSQAQTLASTFNQTWQNLSNLSASLTTTVTTGVASANQLLSDITSLNSQIAQATAGGGSANALVDLRQQKLEQLSGLVGVQASLAGDGTLSVSVGGTQLISGGKQLATLQVYDAGAGQTLWETASTGNPTTYTNPAQTSQISGSIQGTIDARDGTLKSLQNNLNTLATNIISSVYSIYNSGYSLNGTTGQNFFTGFTAATMAVNPNLVSDPSLVQAAGSPNAPGDNTVALALANLGQQSIGALNNQTFSAAYAGYVGTFGDALSNANNQVSNSTAVNQALLNQRDSVSGVSVEEEMSNLITFQKAYEASAKIISTVDQMLSTVIAMKT